MKRISKSIFIAVGHKASWNQKTEYLSCECKTFAFTGKCDFSLKVKDVLEGEGKKVRFKRAPKPIFINEIDIFTETLDKILKGEL